MRVTTYLSGGPYDAQFHSTSDEEMRIVRPDLTATGFVMAAKYVMKPLEGDDAKPRGLGRSPFPPQATHRFRGFIKTDHLLVTDAIRPNKGSEWPEEIT